MAHPDQPDATHSQNEGNPAQQAPQPNNAVQTPHSSRTPRPNSVKMPTPPPFSRSSSGFGQDRSGKAAGGRGDSPRDNGYSSQMPTPESEGRRSPLAHGGGPLSPSASGSAFVFPLRSVFQNKSSQGQQGQAYNDRSVIMKRSPSGHQISSSNNNEPVDPLFGDAGIDSIQQMLEKGSGERRERKQPSGNPGVATFSGRIDRSGSNAGQSGSGGEVPKPQKPASAGIPPSGSEANPSGGFYSMPPSLADKEPSKSPFFEDTPVRRQSISNGQIGRAASSSHQQRPIPESRNSDDSGHTATKPQQPTNSSAAQTAGTGLPDANRAPVGQPQGPVNEINYRHRPGGENIDAATSFSTRKDKERTKPPASPSRPFDRIAQEKREAISAGVKQPEPRNVGKGPMPGLAGPDGSDNRKKQTHLEMDDQGEHQLIRDFSGIVRLGDIGTSSGNGTAGVGGGAVTGSGNGTGSKGQDSAGGSFRSSGVSDTRAQQVNEIRDNSRSSVSKFVENQSHTENMADPNAPTPSQAASMAGYTSEGESVPNTPPPRSPSDASRPATQQSGGESRPPTESSESGSLHTRDSSEMASASEQDEDEDEGASEEDEPIVTFRFEHTQDSDGHHVVVGREGILRRCEDEPITTPGAVQGFGVLIVLEEDFDTGDLVVRQVSEVSLPCPPLRNDADV
jgi:hypothetical protein